MGAAITLSRRLSEVGDAGCLQVTESLLDALDLSFYEFQAVGRLSLRGDRLGERSIYRLQAFQRGVSMSGTALQNSDAEAHCYREALRLRPEYAEAHNNLGVLLRSRGDDENAERHYQQALVARPDYPEAHLNNAILLSARVRPRHPEPPG
jgi:tetratricopeptide (TPR) repeat protein